MGNDAKILLAIIVMNYYLERKDMKHSDIINLILSELDKNGLSLHSHSEIHNTLLPHEKFSSYRSNWSNWLQGKSQRINNAHAKRVIQETIGFEGYIWDADNQTQTNAIRQAVHNFMHPAPVVDLSPLLPKNTALTDAQTHLLLEVRKTNIAQTKVILEQSNFIEALPENQIFLLKLLSLLFEKGMYDYLLSTVFPALLPHNAQDNNVKIFKAHTYGSLKNPEYLKAVSLLQTIDPDTSEQVLEVQTGLVSNLRRYTLEKDPLTKEELLEALTAFRQHYTAIFENTERHHYYPGTNLMYMLKLFMLISPNIPHIDAEDLEQIYIDAKPSITKASHSKSDETRYYAMISDVECRFLVGKNHLLEHLSSWLENNRPSAAYVERTLRMMKFFEHTVERFAVVDSRDILHSLREIMSTLEDYVKHSFTY